MGLGFRVYPKPRKVHQEDPKDPYLLDPNDLRHREGICGKDTSTVACPGRSNLIYPKVPSKIHAPVLIPIKNTNMHPDFEPHGKGLAFTEICSTSQACGEVEIPKSQKGAGIIMPSAAQVYRMYFRRAEIFRKPIQQLFGGSGFRVTLNPKP